MKLRAIHKTVTTIRIPAVSAVVGRYRLGLSTTDYLGEGRVVEAEGYALPGPAPNFALGGASISSPTNDASANRARLLKRDSAGLRAVLNILEKWGVAGERAARLLGTPKRTVYQWAKYVTSGTLRKPLGPDTLDRLSYILGIWKASMILMPTESAAITFVQSPNATPLLAGRSPLDRMLDGRIMDLAAVRAQFDAWRSA